MSSRRGTQSISPARRAAFDVLRRVEAEGSYASTLISGLPRSDLSRDDRALAQEIVLGVLRLQKSLDYFIELYGKRTTTRLDLPVLLSLRMGLYQIRCLSRIPHRAATNDSVNLVKANGATSAAGFVNAVLRAAARRLEDRAGELIPDSIDRESVELSHPRWMLERWANSLGEAATRDLALANNQAPRLAFRLNRLKAGAEDVIRELEEQGVITRSSDDIPGAFLVEAGNASRLMEAAELGLVYLQDEASQLVSLLLDPKPGDRILDFCAAPGSKTTHMADLTGNKGWIVACDIHIRRLGLLKSACSRLGAEGVDALVLDGTQPLPFDARVRKFDRVLLDAPCTGTGTLRRNPEIKWRLTLDDVNRLAAVQQLLLTRASEALADGGRLVYSTCSIEAEENEGVIARFLELNGGFRVVEPNANADLRSGGFVRTFPHRHRMDGFFAAVLEKSG
jgi:16S rRNA (cytosine967-C5)-methyltransferase